MKRRLTSDEHALVLCINVKFASLSEFATFKLLDEKDSRELGTLFETLSKILQYTTSSPTVLK